MRECKIEIKDKSTGKVIVDWWQSMKLMTVADALNLQKFKKETSEVNIVNYRG